MRVLKLKSGSEIILTDRQTDRQTDREILISISSVSLRAWPLLDYIHFPEIVRQNHF